MSDRFSDRDAEREALSALADGEAQSQEVARACAAWRDHADARANWHAYQLIGDVMRSEDLAQASSGEAFLKNFRERLAQEPVVLAPSAAQAQRAVQEQAARQQLKPLKRRTWAGPVGVAAGFVLVVGAMLSSQILPTGPQGGDATLAQSGAVRGGALSLANTGQWSASGFVPDGAHAATLTLGGASFQQPGEVVLIRNPQLDQALALQRANQSGDVSFEGQGALTRQVVFDGR
ncbi:MAG: sigma-E factor negative regulatory protein [Aquabacterium sp.]|uniref:sigma-E factor negative regulatory protein n=1 Tax=Aquabacterium sp. TaxID=1872578 RepID=UPI0025BDAE55|nr:sigma-E factor negative regulatory protein [Aquabacterium sp.]MBI3383039.1 sigma-E factor negative regulatory protein [Aquabacterium sp.]